MKFKILIISLLFILTSSNFHKINAYCVCQDIPLEERLSESDAVFVGKIISIQPLNFYVPFQTHFVAQVFEIEVFRAWETKKYTKYFPKYITILGWDSKECGTIFSKGRTYLFFTKLEEFILNNKSVCGSWEVGWRKKEVDSLAVLKIKEIPLWYPKEIQSKFPLVKVREINKRADLQIVRNEYESKIQKLQSEFKEQLNIRFKYEMLALALIILIWLGVRFIKF
jgi:hypothetical protein